MSMNQPATREARLRAMARVEAFNKHAHYCLDCSNPRGHVQGMNDSEWGFSTCPHPDCALVREPQPEAAPAIVTCEGCGNTDLEPIYYCHNCGLHTELIDGTETRRARAARTTPDSRGGAIS